MSETRPLTDTPDGCWAPQWTVALPVIAKLVVKGTTSSLTAVTGQPESRGAGRRAGLAGVSSWSATRPTPEGTAPARAGLHLDHKAAQGRRAARSSAGKDRAAWPARDRGPAAHARQARGPPGDHPGHRRPLRQGR